MRADTELELIKGLTDIAYSTSAPEKSFCFPGPVLLGEPRLPYVRALAEKFLALNLIDATVTEQGATWRCHKDVDVVDGIWVRFRRTPDAAPSFDTLGMRLPAPVTEFLLQAEHNRGGLILIMGAAGTGKTTTASATVVSRLQRFGGYCQTVEEPPEYPINGWHKNGYCTQTWVKETGPNAWADAMKNALRSQAVGTPGMLFLGEVREDAAAKIALVAATNGFLVICTAFATSVESGISSFSDRLEESQIPMFSKMLRGVVYQNMLRDLFSFQLLAVDLSVEQMISTKKFASIQGELNRQNNMRRMEGSTTTVAGGMLGERVSRPAQAPLAAPSAQAPAPAPVPAAASAPAPKKIGGQTILFDIGSQPAPAPAASTTAPVAAAEQVAPAAEAPAPVFAAAPSPADLPGGFASEQMPSEEAAVEQESFQVSGFVDSPAFNASVKRDAPAKQNGWMSRFLKK